MKQIKKSWVFAAIIVVLLAFAAWRYLLPRPVSVLDGWRDTQPAILTVINENLTADRATDFSDSAGFARLTQLLRETRVAYRSVTDAVPAAYQLIFRGADGELYDAIQVADEGFCGRLYIENRAYAISSQANRLLLEELDRLTA